MSYTVSSRETIIARKQQKATSREVAAVGGSASAGERRPDTDQAPPSPHSEQVIEDPVLIEEVEEETV